MMGVYKFFLYSVDREGFSDKVIFEQRPEEQALCTLGKRGFHVEGTASIKTWK